MDPTLYVFLVGTIFGGGFLNFSLHRLFFFSLTIEITFERIVSLQVSEDTYEIVWYAIYSIDSYMITNFRPKMNTVFAISTGDLIN